MKVIKMKHIIIAGTARSGKTTLCYKLHQNGYVHLKLDSIKRAICDIYGDKNNWKDFSPKTAKIIARVFKEAETDTIADVEKYAIDTCHLLPTDAVSLSKDNIVIFIGYTDITPEEGLLNIRKYDRSNYWTTKLSDDEILTMLKENIEFSCKIKQECSDLSLKYFDTSHNRDKVLNDIVKYINTINR